MEPLLDEDPERRRDETEDETARPESIYPN